MSDHTKQKVDTSSMEFSEGVEAGLNSTEDTRNWKAGNELGQELKDETENKERISEKLINDSSIPLFVKDSSGGIRGNAQDEKDETEE